jgi:hypothetical protein
VIKDEVKVGGTLAFFVCVDIKTSPYN